ncbi:hypothetical protein [Microvirga subterranea]|uniref:DUF3887 domain-containing protein n=1 Tax=Microvirga subterranea TaxID=186651 RepID=A0A370HKW1_9HYPH|nr:hypothetical protein [Microvirga subterranea]RDI56338.1 hypothetical protein DES45_10922 [Microvirga subterranea]
MTRRNECRGRHAPGGAGTRLGLAVATIIAMVPAWAARAEPLTPFSVINVSEALTRAYNGRDAVALHQLLAPALQARYTPEMLRTSLSLCRVLTGEILRLSTPSWGTRSYGFFGVYAETGVFDMVLEIDEAERVVYWTISDEVTSREQQCEVGGSAPLPGD